jgi:hypothetical protein
MGSDEPKISIEFGEYAFKNSHAVSFYVDVTNEGTQALSLSWLAVQVEFLGRNLREDFLGTHGCFPRAVASPFRLAIASALIVTA